MMLSNASATVTETDPLVVAIVSVSLTLVVGLIVGIVTAQLARKSESDKWLRDRRMEIYEEFVAGTDFINSAMRQADVRPTSEAKAKAAEILARLALVGTRELYAAAMAHQEAAFKVATSETMDTFEEEWETYRQARGRFLIQARRELGISVQPKRKGLLGALRRTTRRG